MCRMTGTFEEEMIDQIFGSVDVSLFRSMGICIELLGGYRKSNSGMKMSSVDNSIVGDCWSACFCFAGWLDEHYIDTQQRDCR